MQTQFKEASPRAIKANVDKWRREHQLDRPQPQPQQQQKTKAVKLPKPNPNNIKLSDNRIVLQYCSTTGEIEVES